MSPLSILITGASSGLGEALARHYAAPGATLFLSGRDAGRLENVAGESRAKGAEVHVEVLDVTDAARMAEWIERCDAMRLLDLVIANAGISAGTAGRHEGPAQTRAIFAVNVDGVFNTVLPAMELMRARGHGQIALVSSLASFRGMPGAPAYCASKAAVRVWGEALRGELAKDGVRVSVICPGFVTTRMTAANDFPMPFLMGADKAARIMADGLARNMGRISYPWPMAALSWLTAALPDKVMDWLARRLPAKGAD
ncbi:MAG TPA: SDR family NAD(P)-dependent oxidoreductase [Magnetospirillum sp.]|jgi:short-subunit dehydrogenase|nr:SDR family NAD(P)-dependent oxidoreductase [Magnetospirillum sp.]